MQQAGAGCLIVEDGGHVRGILSERDLVMKLTDGNLAATTVADLMTADPVVLRPDDSIAVAINKMAVGGFRHIPLVVNGQATGIVTARDVFRHILSSQDAPRPRAWRSVTAAVTIGGAAPPGGASSDRGWRAIVASPGDDAARAQGERRGARGRDPAAGPAVQDNAANEDPKEPRTSAERAYRGRASSRLAPEDEPPALVPERSP